MHQTTPPKVFLPALRKLRLDRAACNAPLHSFLLERLADDALDRLETVTKPFPKALFYGPGAPLLAAKLTPAAGAEDVVIAGESAAYLKALGAQDPAEAAADTLPFADRSFDLVVSLMSLHAVNDLPGALQEIRRVLRPDGFFVGSFPAEDTLRNLREALRDAEAGLSQSVAPRVAPFLQIKDGGALLQRAGLTMPVVDSQPIKVSYREPLRLFQDLRGMGESQNLARGPRGALRRDVLAEVLERLRGEDILFHMLVMTGWAPDPSQPKPLKPGSAKASLADAVLRGSGE